MGLETATYISDFNVNNPTQNDPVGEGDNHIKMIKYALKTTFPSITGAVTGTHTAINSAVVAANAATNANTASTIVKRNASGNFTAGTITAALTGDVKGDVKNAAGAVVLAAGDADTAAIFTGTVTGLESSLNGKVDNSQVLTDVPANAVFVDTNTTYSAGSGITLSGTTFSNSSPDQTVALTGAGATTVTGAYPNFTITSTDTDTNTNTTYGAGTGITLSGTTFSNSAPDQTVALTGAGATSVSGTYPNFTITSTDTDTNTNTTYSAGTGISLNGTTFSANGSAITGVNAAKVDNFSISTNSTGTDANTIYFRT